MSASAERIAERRQAAAAQRRAQVRLAGILALVGIVASAAIPPGEPPGLVWVGRGGVVLQQRETEWVEAGFVVDGTWLASSIEQALVSAPPTVTVVPSGWWSRTIRGRLWFRAARSWTYRPTGATALESTPMAGGSIALEYWRE